MFVFLGAKIFRGGKKNLDLDQEFAGLVRKCYFLDDLGGIRLD
jgi:hypothetical protein